MPTIRAKSPRAASSHASAAATRTRPKGSAPPRHVAIIMDGNGRWAQARELTRLEGHEAGYKNIEPVLEWLGAAGVKYVTLFGFSTENWGRPDDEVNGLLDLLALGLDEQVERLHRRNTRIIHIGRNDRISKDLREGIRQAVRTTARNTGLTLCVAFDYGGRQDIVQAVQRAIADGVTPDQVTEESFTARLYTAGVPDPDLVVRTGGEFRISNFLLWQSAYAEFYSTECNWPDLSATELGAALGAFASRDRRFGRVSQSTQAAPGRGGPRPSVKQ